MHKNEGAPTKTKRSMSLDWLGSNASHCFSTKTKALNCEQRYSQNPRPIETGFPDRIKAYGMDTRVMYKGYIFGM